MHMRMHRTNIHRTVHKDSYTLVTRTRPRHLEGLLSGLLAVVARAKLHEQLVGGDDIARHVETRVEWHHELVVGGEGLELIHRRRRTHELLARLREQVKLA